MCVYVCECVYVCVCVCVCACGVVCKRRQNEFQIINCCDITSFVSFHVMTAFQKLVEPLGHVGNCLVNLQFGVGHVRFRFYMQFVVFYFPGRKVTLHN